MTAWLVIVFAVFGLIAPRNVLVYVTILLCALSFSSAIFFILELDTPIDGFIYVSSEPLRDAAYRRLVDGEPAAGFSLLLCSESGKA
jgi:hypothetical protein